MSFQGVKQLHWFSRNQQSPGQQSENSLMTGMHTLKV